MDKIKTGLIVGAIIIAILAVVLLVLPNDNEGFPFSIGLVMLMIPMIIIAQKRRDEING